MKYRSRSEIIAQILTTGSEVDGVTKTRIMFRAFLSYNQLKDYLAIVIENGLLEYDSQTGRYRTTSKGTRLLETFQQINDLTGAAKDGQGYVGQP